MPAELRRRHGGSLLIPLPRRPTVIANFVSSLDGVVALDPIGTSGGAEISGFFEPDRFVMGLLRSLADAVLVGSGTVRAAPDHRWIADEIHPPSSPAFRTWRRRMGLASQPTTVVVTASGELDPSHPGLSDPAIPVIIATTEAGKATAAERAFGSHVSIVALGGESVPARELLARLGSLGFELVLCEGGPHLLSQIAEASLLDELFLTVAPQLIGRPAGVPRLALLEGGVGSREPAWGTVRSVRRAGDHLFLRYTFA